MAERSKALVLGTSLPGDVGSNPTAVSSVLLLLSRVYRILSHVSLFFPCCAYRARTAYRREKLPSGKMRSHRDSNSDRWIQSPECSPLHHGTRLLGPSGI